MKKVKVNVRPGHHSQYSIEGGELFALEGIVLAVAGGWWPCHIYGWHWLVGMIIGIAILTGFMWLLSMKITRLLLFGLNALSAGLLAYLLATALFNVTELTGAFVGIVVSFSVGTLLFGQFEVFQHDLRVYRRLKREQEE